jgi:hypothetical protein
VAPALPTDGASLHTFEEKRTERSMALSEAAKRVAAEFEYSGDDIRKSTKEFLREMGRFRVSVWRSYGCGGRQ